MTSPTGIPLDPSSTIGQAFKIYREHAAVLLPLAFGLYAIQAVVAIAVGTDDAGSRLIASAVGTVVGILLQGAVVELARDVEDGTLDSSPGQLLAAVTPVILPLFVIGILMAIGFIIGLILIIVPGFIFLTVHAVTAPVAVLERPGIFAAFTRSRQLVKGSAGPVFGLILFTFVLGILGGILGSVLGAGTADAGKVVAGWIVTSLLAPASALIIAVAYLRLRELHGEAPLSAGAATPSGPSFGS